MSGYDDYLPGGTWGGDPAAPWNQDPDEGHEQAVEAEVIDAEREAETVRRMALAQALYKTIKDEVATGKAHNLRGEFDAIMRERYEQARRLGVAPKSFDVAVDGEKVGSFSITVDEGEPARDEVRLRVCDPDAFELWAGANGFLRTSVDMAAVEAYFAEEGDVPDGCEAEVVHVPERRGGGIKRTSLRVDPEKVSYAMGASLGESVRWLLGEGA